jgi:hypothetical protein
MLKFKNIFYLLFDQWLFIISFILLANIIIYPKLFNIDKKAEINNYKHIVSESIKNIKHSLLATSLSEQDLKPAMDYLDNVQMKIDKLSYPIIVSAPENKYDFQLELLKQTYIDLKHPEKWLSNVATKIELPVTEYIRLFLGPILAPIETKVNLLYEERLRERDVIKIVLLLLTPLYGTNIIIKISREKLKQQKKPKEEEN